MGASGFGTTEDIPGSIPNDGFVNDPFGGGDPFGGDTFGSTNVFASQQNEVPFSNSTSAFDDSDNPFETPSSPRMGNEQKPLVPNREPFRFKS